MSIAEHTFYVKRGDAAGCDARFCGQAAGHPLGAGLRPVRRGFQRGGGRLAHHASRRAETLGLLYKALRAGAVACKALACQAC